MSFASDVRIYGRQGAALPGEPLITGTEHPRQMANWTPADNDLPFVVLGKQTIGAGVRSRRLLLGWSQRGMSRRVGVSQSVISRLETGRLNGIRWQTFARIVGVLQAYANDVHRPRG
jgi:DNA-binding Xre family transcriptional regulator